MKRTTTRPIKAQQIALLLVALSLIVAVIVAARLMAARNSTPSTAASDRSTSSSQKRAYYATPASKAKTARSNAAKKPIAKAPAKPKSAPTVSSAPAQNHAAVTARTQSQAVVGQKLYVDPSLKAQGRPSRIADQPIASWFGGWNTNVRADVDRLVGQAARQGKVATLVAYNIPARDCGSYSAGGAGSSSAYRAWIDEFARGIGSRSAIVIIEPDALAGMDCLSAAGQSQRTADIAYAVSTLGRTSAISYIDAGHAEWHATDVMAQRLRAANVANARGFSLNVSNYLTTSQSNAYGQKLSAALKLGNKGFVVDTSRNGNGPTRDRQWCNPKGRALGNNPTTVTNQALADAYLWVKVPGESDGTCGGGPAAGQWWQSRAEEMIANSR